MSRKLRVLDALEATVAGPAHNTLRIGAVLPLSGVLGQAGPSALEAVLLAGEEVQTSAGSSATPLELVLLDSGGPPTSVAQAVRHLALEGIVDAFVGLHTSDVLEAIEEATSGFPLPYVFTAGHESRPRPPGFFSSGESADDMAQGIRRVIADRGVYRWAIIGSDYVWPRAVGASGRAVIEDSGGEIVLERLIPLRSTTVAAPRLVAQLAVSGADAVLLSMPGRDLIEMLTALRESGLDRRVVVYSGTLEENVLYALDGNRSGNLYSTQHSFETLRSPQRVEFNARFTAAYGTETPALNSWAEHCYDGVHMIAGLARSGLLSAENLSMDTASVPDDALALRPEYNIQLAVAAGMSFEIV
ncbi:MAG: ABC transporter substrate-binding protein [Microbacterium sp.]